MSGTTASVKAYLSRLRALETVIASRKRLLDRLRRERTYISGVRYDKERVQTSGDADQNRDSDRLIDLERDIARKVEKAVVLRESMIAEIEQVQSPQYVALLLHRYVDGMRFEEIACEMGYSYARVTHLHGEALQAFGRLREAQETDCHLSDNGCGVGGNRAVHYESL